MGIIGMWGVMMMMRCGHFLRRRTTVGERGVPNRTRFYSGSCSEQMLNRCDSVVVLFGCMALDRECVEETGA